MIKVDAGKDQYEFEGDKNQWILYKVGENKKTKERTSLVEGYYSTLDSLLRNLLERKLRASDANNLTELKMALDKAKYELLGYYDTEISK